MSHTAIMLNEHTDPTYLSISTKIEPTATATSHLIATYVPETNMPLKSTCETTVSVYISHMNSMQSIM